MDGANPLITAIICSVNVDNLHRTVDNLRATAGVPIEILAFDNRGKTDGICGVYNRLAAQAKASLLLFIHEDVIFHDAGWADKIIRKMTDPSTGIVGFAGSTYKPKAYSGWYIHSIPECMRGNVDHPRAAGFKLLDRHHDISKTSFAEVVTLDGLALFMRKDVWETYPFDDVLLRGFHCYDIDISLRTYRGGLKNYVWYGVSVSHLSCGQHNASWVYETVKIHDKKWCHLLPLGSIVDVATDARYGIEAYEDYFFMMRAMHTELPIMVKLRVVFRYVCKMLTMKSYLKMPVSVFKKNQG